MPARQGVLHLFAILVLLLSASPAGKAQGKASREYGILIDNTGSMRSQFETVVQLSKSIVHQIHDQAPVSIFSFESAAIGRGSRAVPRLRFERSRDEELLDRTIEGVYVQGGQTTLLDAIGMIADRLSEPSSDTEKSVVLITDGEERASTKSQKEVIQKLKDLKIKVYAIGLVQDLEPGKRTKATNLLQLICRETGGRAVVVEPGNVKVERVINDLALPN